MARIAVKNPEQITKEVNSKSIKYFDETEVLLKKDENA